MLKVVPVEGMVFVGRKMLFEWEQAEICACCELLKIKSGFLCRNPLLRI